MTESAYGLWWDPRSPDVRVAGRITWEALRSPELTLLDAPPNMWAGPNAELGGPLSLSDIDIPILHGNLADKGAVTLLHCRFGGLKLNRTSTNTLRVGTSLVGLLLDSPSEPYFRRLEAQMPALEGLLGSYPILPDWPRSERARGVRIKLDDRKTVWNDGQTEIEWRYHFLGTQKSTSAEMRMIPTLTLSSASPRSIGDWLAEWLIPLNSFVQLASGTKANPKLVTAWHKRYPHRTERSTAGFDISLAGVGDHDYRFEPHRVLATTSSIGPTSNALHQVVRNYNTLATSQSVFLGLLSGLVTLEDRPLRNRYLDLISALEAYHTQKYGLARVSMDDFKTRRKEALAACRAAGIPGPELRFLKRWLPTRPSESLESRLSRLKSDVRAEQDWDVSAEEMQSLRNDIAHGNANQNSRLLMNAYEQGFDLARHLFLKDLGL